MGIRMKIKQALRWLGANGEDITEDITKAYTSTSTQAVLSARMLAFEICVQRISKAVMKCEFQTFSNHKNKKGNLYYRLNVRPNANESAPVFWNRVIHKLYYKQEALIVSPGRTTDEIYLADSYTLDDSQVLNGWKFKNVTIGNLTLNKTFQRSEVIYLKLENKKVKQYLDGTTAIFAELMNTARNSYKRSNGSKFKAKIGRIQSGTDAEERVKKLLNEDMKKFMESENAVLAEYEGVSVEEMDPKTVKQSDTRDIKALFDDILEITSKAFLIPVNIAAGEVTDTSKAVDDFLTFCLDSLLEIIQDEINGTTALFSKTNYLNGSYVRINAQAIKHIDIMDVAGSIDKLISSGVFTINMILEVLQMEPLKEEWADAHFITKNYSLIENVLNSLESGEGGKKNNA